MRVVTFKVDEELLEKLDYYARQRGKTRSEVIREALEHLLREEVGEPTTTIAGIKIKKIRIL